MERLLVERHLSHNDKNTMQSLMLVVLLHECVPSALTFLPLSESAWLR